MRVSVNGEQREISASHVDALLSVVVYLVLYF
jgi:hypothetical protein